ncbi:DNA-binding transcriptional LysR family regulator [Streptosporangium becharense]|uniref:DNA-binding transcriptional LysR family regulator n=1 Tax=Streptosporangium becharense TaxID=1816182 RepID=A0A7W9IFU5_9ACTN|nr:LysR family transcriptional regulator [Streptosporangium becharense]MBB2909033.1 DNA-binding transcriptional LysR family regulator [Streptosporangium becharense]MBB5819949.1 DNA-binding transcriptional LysR family regulator [Streptosporangium becharense]
MLDLNRLKALHAVSVYGSVGAAAEALMVTPSAVSQQLAKLEREIGATLLERNGRGVRLTDAAGLLADHAGRILALVETAEADFEALRGEVVGRLSIGAFPTAARGLLPGALTLLRDRHPDLHLQLMEREPERQVREVIRGELDLAVVQDWMNRPMSIPEGLSRAQLLDDIADVVLPASHPLAGRPEVELAELSGERWISSSPGTVCHDWLVYTLRSAELEPEIACMADEYPTQMALVAAGQGCAIIPRLGRGPLPADVRAVPIRPRPTRKLYAIWRSDAARRPAIRAAVDALKTIAAGLPSSTPDLPSPTPDLAVR